MKNNIQRKGKRHNTAVLGEKAHLIAAQEQRSYQNTEQTLTRKKLSCLDMAAPEQTAKIEETLKTFL
jgi:hypothetical protein